jgi:hypothetical protein
MRWPRAAGTTPDGRNSGLRRELLDDAKPSLMSPPSRAGRDRCLGRGVQQPLPHQALAWTLPRSGSAESQTPSARPCRCGGPPPRPRSPIRNRQRAPDRSSPCGSSAPRPTAARPCAESAEGRTWSVRRPRRTCAGTPSPHTGPSLRDRLAAALDTTRTMLVRPCIGAGRRVGKERAGPRPGSMITRNVEGASRPSTAATEQPWLTRTTQVSALNEP